MDAQTKAKQAAAEAAVAYVEDGIILGVGTGSTVNHFIRAVADSSIKLAGAVPSSVATRRLLDESGIKVIEPQEAQAMPLYVDGADQVNRALEMIKGGGGALTGEKILVGMSGKFVCIADESKLVDKFTFPLPIEVIPLGQALVSEEVRRLGGQPVPRDGRSDYGNVIIDAHGIDIAEPRRQEQELDSMPGVVTNGIFALRPADVLLLGSLDGQVATIERPAR